MAFITNRIQWLLLQLEFNDFYHNSNSMTFITTPLHCETKETRKWATRALTVPASVPDEPTNKILKITS